MDALEQGNVKGKSVVLHEAISHRAVSRGMSGGEESREGHYCNKRKLCVSRSD